MPKNDPKSRKTKKTRKLLGYMKKNLESLLCNKTQTDV